MLLTTVLTCRVLSVLPPVTALSSGLYKFGCLQCFRPVPAGKRDLLKFHSSDYLSFLQNVSIDNQVCIAALPTLLLTQRSIFSLTVCNM